MDAIISERKLEPLRIEIGNLKSTGGKLKKDLMNLEVLYNLPLDADILLDLFGFEAMNHYSYPSMYSNGYNKQIPEKITICGEEITWTLHGIIIITVDDFVNILHRNYVKLNLTRYAINKYFA